MRACLFTIIAISIMCLPGCASQYPQQRTNVAYYPACYRPLQDIRENEHTVGKSTAAGAFIGAASGALIGFLATGRWEGALMGGAMGGVGGSMVGHSYGTQQQQRSDNMRLNAYLQRIDGDISNLDATSAAARVSLQCYDREFQRLIAGIRGHQITREVAQRRFVEIQNGREEAIAILGDTASYATALDDQYERAFASEEQQIQTPASLSQGRAAYQQNTRTLNTARQRKREIARKAQDIRQEKNNAQNVTKQQTREINEVLAQLDELRV